MEYVNTARLRIAYRQYGDVQGEPLFLLHGWPDDMHTWDGMLPALTARGLRIIVPSLRGCGETRFLAHDTPRAGQLSALAQDLLDLADALGVQRFNVCGHDWGARAAYIAALLAPQRVLRCMALSVGWGTNDAHQALSLHQARNFWYQWFLSTERGEETLRRDRREFALMLWRSWSPSWHVAEGAFHDTMHSFDNPDWVDVTVHSYRHRWGLAPSDPAYAMQEDHLRRESTISVPTLTLHGSEDHCCTPQSSEHREHLFSGPYHRALLVGVGHFPQREQPAGVADALLAWLERTNA